MKNIFYTSLVYTSSIKLIRIKNVRIKRYIRLTLYSVYYNSNLCIRLISDKINVKLKVLETTTSKFNVNEIPNSYKRGISFPIQSEKSNIIKGTSSCKRVPSNHWFYHWDFKIIIIVFLLV